MRGSHIGAIIALAAFGLQGCVHQGLGRQSQYFHNDAVALHDDRCPGMPVGVEIQGNTATSHTVRNADTMRYHACRFSRLSIDQFRRFENNDEMIRYRNYGLFGIATYMGATVLLNTEGLRESQTEDLTEAALGATLLTGLNRIHDPQLRSNLHFNAARASACAARELHYLSELEAQVFAGQASRDRIDTVITSLETVIANMDALLDVHDDDPADDEDIHDIATAVRAEATRQLERARAMREPLNQNITAYARTQRLTAYQVYDNYGDRILHASRSQGFNLADVLTAFQTNQTANTASIRTQQPNPELPEKSLLRGAEEPPQIDAGRQAVRTAHQDLNQVAAALPDQLPDVATQIARFQLCVGLFNADFDLPDIQPQGQDTTLPPPVEQQPVENDDGDDEDEEDEEA